MTDDLFMRRALDLAARGLYSVSPNPMVGCVITRDGRVLGEGFHHRAGEPHAEVEALENCTEDPAGATAYVTLEPCCHTGRTGPCTERLLAAGVHRVVAAMGDPNPMVNGRGFELLRKADVVVDIGLFAAEAEQLNEKFCYSIRSERPFVLLKAGMTLDAKLATTARDSRWITSAESRERSLMLREEYDAILVGAGTLRSDNPSLSRRLGLSTAQTPWLRVVITADGDLPPDSRILGDGGRTLVITGRPGRIEGSESVEVVTVKASNGRIDLEEVLSLLFARNVMSLLVEGGSLVHTDFLRRRLWQKMIVFVAPMLVGGATAPALLFDESVQRLSDAHRFRFERVDMIGSDLMISAYPC